MAPTLLPSFVASYIGLLQEEGNLPRARKSDGFDPNAYKPMKKSGCDFSKPPPLRNVIKIRPHAINDTQKMIEK